MKVIDQEPQWWYLFENDDGLFLDAYCNHGFVGYSFMLQLNPQELASYQSEGRAFINRLATEIQDSAPILEISSSRFKGRDVSNLYSAQVMDAIEQWYAISASSRQ